VPLDSALLASVAGEAPLPHDSVLPYLPPSGTPLKIPRVSPDHIDWESELGGLIATGTPAGVGQASGTYLKPGDHMEATINRLGTLVSPVEAE